MTADSDDVADSADQKPKGSLEEHGPDEAPTKPGQQKPEHPTGEAQAEQNKRDELPA